MSTEQVALRFREGCPAVFVRELTGNDERCVRDASTRTVVDLLRRLVVWPAGIKAQADELTAPDRDRLLAAIYTRTYGKSVESAAVCTVCSSPYDITFSLDDLRAAVDRNAQPSEAWSFADGTFRMANGFRFRLPVARDEIEVSHFPPEEAVRELAARCLLESPAHTSPAAEDRLNTLETAMEEIAPVFDLDIDTTCPECGSRQLVRFDLQFYLLRAIEQDRAQMFREIHRIASAYGWSLKEILSMGCSERRRLVQLIDGDLGAQRRRS